MLTGRSDAGVEAQMRHLPPPNVVHRKAVSETDKKDVASEATPSVTARLDAFLVQAAEQRRDRAAADR
jgi:hypothetical protein